MSKSLISFNGQDDPTSFLPVGWKAEQLNATCDIFGGGRLGLTKEKDYRSSGALAFSAAGPDGFVEQVEISNKSGVILSAIGANCGRCFYAQGDWTTLANVQAIVPKSEINPKYLYYFVNRDGYWDKSGSAQPFIKPSSIRLSWVGYPPKPEQSKIAEVLSKVDQAIEETESLIAKQQRIKTGLMQDLLTKGIDEHGNLRSEETHEFKDSPIGRIPVEWDFCYLNDCVPTLAPICYGILMPGYGHIGGVPVIKVKDVVGGRIKQDDLLLTDPKIDSLYRRSRLKHGDLLLTIRGTTGRIAIVPSELEGANITQDTARIRLKDGNSNNFFYFLLQTQNLQDQINLHTLGQAVKGINIGEVKRLHFGLPDKHEQLEIANRMVASQRLLNDSEGELSKLRSFKTALMQDLLTGKKRVTPLLEKTEVHS